MSNKDEKLIRAMLQDMPQVVLETLIVQLLKEHYDYAALEVVYKLYKEVKAEINKG